MKNSGWARALLAPSMTHPGHVSYGLGYPNIPRFTRSNVPYVRNVHHG